MNKDMLEGNWDTQGRASSFVWLLFKVHEQKTVVREIIKQLAHDHSPDYWGMSPKERRQVTQSDLLVNMLPIVLLLNRPTSASKRDLVCGMLLAGCPQFRTVLVNKPTIYGLMSHDTLKMSHKVGDHLRYKFKMFHNLNAPFNMRYVHLITRTTYHSGSEFVSDKKRSQELFGMSQPFSCFACPF